MGVRVEAGEGGGRRACVRRRRARLAREQPVSCRAAPRSIAAERPSACPRAQLYYATRVPRSLVLWCFMMVRHESARYADVP